MFNFFMVYILNKIIKVYLIFKQKLDVSNNTIWFFNIALYSKQFSSSITVDILCKVPIIHALTVLYQTDDKLVLLLILFSFIFNTDLTYAVIYIQC
jgi:hypothetical protein